jgi:hypothetical protein
MPPERTPERSKRVAIGGFILTIALMVVAAVTGIWFAYIVAAVALLFALGAAGSNRRLSLRWLEPNTCHRLRNGPLAAETRISRY